MYITPGELSWIGPARCVLQKSQVSIAGDVPYHTQKLTEISHRGCYDFLMNPLPLFLCDSPKGQCGSVAELGAKKGQTQPDSEGPLLAAGPLCIAAEMHIHDGTLGGAAWG